jgi:beta-glucanase (GH16 family)
MVGRFITTTMGEMRKGSGMRLIVIFLLVITMTGWTEDAKPALDKKPAAVPARPGWKLVWADEFDYEGLPDPKKWIYEVGFERNRELQYYTRDRKENARVENGHLIIEARKEEFANPKFDPKAGKDDFAKSTKTAQYTSASITTAASASWTYGRMEVRAKIPTGRGMWPAIWTLGTNIKDVSWPLCGEIDIMENVGFDPNGIHHTAHTKAYNHSIQTQKGKRTEVVKPFEDFHVYAIEWTEKKIDFFIDEKLCFTFENDGKGVEAWPFDKPQYLILNLAVGGAWGGAKGVDDTIFPQKFIIDYARVYQRE